MNDPIVAAFDKARDEAVAEIMETCCGGGGQRALTTAAIQAAFQPVLDEVRRRLHRRSVDDIEWWI